ncbi:hypothetical protein RhiirA1_540744 [Rhizophagus irregularis]|uniref:Uncharacterized protein n=1 Tax=Rhizophagus irregularis TaxID=588596 RepID=A0A2N0R6Q9_9GLOM|nr:hypothetical protein RhiirA1_540744 [Rhizophagus irregularis]
MTSNQNTDTQTLRTTQNITDETAPMEIEATTSTHILSNSEQDVTLRDLQKENDIHTQTPITSTIQESTYMEEDHIELNTNKGKSAEYQTNTQNELPDKIHFTMLNNLFEQTPQDLNKAHKAFVPKDSFQPNISNNDIINILKTAFINDNNAFKFEVNVLSTYRYFTIYFRTRDSLEQYIKNSPPSLKNIKIYELNKTTINTLIEQKFKNLDNAVIKIMDIPYNYDTKMLLKHLANKTSSAILEHTEIKKPPRKISNRNNQKKPIFIKPAYKQLIVRFQKQTAYDYFMKEDYWSLEIENFLVRILPGNSEDQEYKKRTSKFFKITGLPINTTVRDIDPIIKHVYGRTCTFTQPSKYSTMKNAYVYVHPDNYPKDVNSIVSTPFNGSPVYIHPCSLSPKTCNICGSHTHTIQNCDEKNFILDKNNRKIFTKRIIKRNEEKITINEDYKSKFSHVITLNATNARHNEYQNHTRPQQQMSRQNQNKYISPFSQHKEQNTPHDQFRQNERYPTSKRQNNDYTSDISTQDKIRNLENQVATLTEKINKMENILNQNNLQMDNIQKNYTTITESNFNIVNSKQDRYDEILQRLTDNLAKLSDKIIDNERSIKSPKRSSPYDKSSYEQTKRKYHLRSNKQSRASAEDSDAVPATDEDLDLQDTTTLTDNTTYEGIIEPDSDYTPNTSTFMASSYNPLNIISGMTTRK